jgi:hypothetical protein
MLGALGAIAVGACGASTQAGRVYGATGSLGTRVAAAPTRLTITLYPDGVAKHGARQFELRCSPARGTVPHARHACRALAALHDPFAPVPAGSICAFFVLGPQQARITGALRGERVDALLSLRGSCEVERWRRVRSVVPGFPRS